MYQNKPFIAVLAVALILFGVIFGVAFVENSANTFDFLRNTSTLEECVKADVTSEEIPILSARLDYCYNAIFLQSELNEFTIRRLVFQSQHSSDIVLLWMVVFITIGGVLLSGLQLYTSYRMTLEGKGGPTGPDALHSLEVERGKVALRSSVTGLFILIISFAFFYIFVIFVYQIDDRNIASQDTGAADAFSSRIGNNSYETFPGVFGTPIAQDENTNASSAEPEQKPPADGP